MSALVTPVRVGELAVASGPGEVLEAVGVGSGVVLVLADPRRGVAGLAHVALPARVPAAGDAGHPAATSADTAVPALLLAVLAAGARRPLLDAHLVGGARLFDLGRPGLGARVACVLRATLAAAGIPVAGEAPGGDAGSGVRVRCADGLVRAASTDGAPLALEAPVLASPAPPPPLPRVPTDSGPHVRTEQPNTKDGDDPWHECSWSTMRCSCARWCPTRWSAAGTR